MEIFGNPTTGYRTEYYSAMIESQSKERSGFNYVHMGKIRLYGFFREGFENERKKFLSIKDKSSKNRKSKLRNRLD